MLILSIFINSLLQLKYFLAYGRDVSDNFNYSPQILPSSRIQYQIYQYFLAISKENATKIKPILHMENDQMHFRK